MKISKKIRQTIKVLLTIAFMSTFISGCNSADAKLTELDYKAVIVDDLGKIKVTERITFEVPSSPSEKLCWELWRALPEEYVDGVLVSYRVNSVKQIFDSGEVVVYQESSELYWYDDDFALDNPILGPGKWYHSPGPYSEAQRQYECVLFYVDCRHDKKVIFEIEYEMFNASLRYADASEFYVSLYAEETVKNLKSVKAQILFPQNLMPKAGNYNAYTYGTNANKFPFEESDSLNSGYHTFSFELNKSQLRFKDYNQYIEFALIAYGSDKHSFTQNASINEFYNSEKLEEINREQKKYELLPKEYFAKKAIALILCTVVAAALLVLVIANDKRIRRKYKLDYQGPEIIFFRDIPSELDPIFAATLVFCKDKKRDVQKEGLSAIMLSLIRKGYIELEKISATKDWVARNINIRLKDVVIPSNNVDGETPVIEYHDTREALSKNEESFLNLIRRHASEQVVSQTTFQMKVDADYNYTNTFIKGIDKSIASIGVQEGYFQKADYDKVKNGALAMSIILGIVAGIVLIFFNLTSASGRMDLAFGAYFILGFALVASAFLVAKFARKYVLLTSYGQDEYAKWYALYKFLNSETLMSERTVIELPLWEHYLVYATAFGISEKVLKAIKIRCQNVQDSAMLSNQYIHTRSFYHSGRSLHAISKSSSTNATYGSRGGGWTGYGGGGRGGGGGGGSY